MNKTILQTPRTLSFVKRIVKYLPPAIQRRLPKEAAVVEVSPRRSRAFNLRYRKKDKAANVLSFRYGKDYGEILVCPSVIRAEAKQQGNSFQYQMTWMIAHGMIHLSGLHHEASPTAAEKAHRLEQRILRTMGL